MKNKNIYQIISVVISLIGIGVMGYSDAKGLDHNYGYTLLFFGLALSMFILLFSGKVKTKK